MLLFFVNAKLFSYSCCLLQEILNNLCLQSKIKESTQSESQKLYSSFEGNDTYYKYMAIENYKWMRQISRLNVDPKSDPMRLMERRNVDDVLSHRLLEEFDEMVDLFWGIIWAYD